MASIKKQIKKAQQTEDRKKSKNVSVEIHAKCLLKGNCQIRSIRKGQLNTAN